MTTLRNVGFTGFFASLLVSLVCSTTLWIGHLGKHTKEGELKEELAKYGEITSFNASVSNHWLQW